MKLCKDCKWFEKPWLIAPENAYCNAPQNITVNMVTGKQTRKVTYCAAARIWQCGSEAKWYEPNIT